MFSEAIDKAIQDAEANKAASFANQSKQLFNLFDKQVFFSSNFSCYSNR